MNLRTALLAAALAVIAAPAMAANVLANPGFETGSLGPWFQDRDFNGHAGPVWAVENTTVNSGAFAAGVGDNYELRQNFTPVSTADISQVSVWAITPGMAYDFFYTDGTDDEFSFGGTTSWQMFNLTSQLAAGKVLEGVSFWGNTGGNAFIDDAVVNVAGVPESATWALMLAGVGMIGAGLRVSRRKTVPAALA